MAPNVSNFICGVKRERTKGNPAPVNRINVSEHAAQTAHSLLCVIDDGVGPRRNEKLTNFLHPSSPSPSPYSSPTLSSFAAVCWLRRRRRSEASLNFSRLQRPLLTTAFCCWMMLPRIATYIRGQNRALARPSIRRDRFFCFGYPSCRQRSLTIVWFCCCCRRRRRRRRRCSLLFFFECLNVSRLIRWSRKEELGWSEATGCQSCALRRAFISHATQRTHTTATTTATTTLIFKCYVDCWPLSPVVYMSCVYLEIFLW